MPEIPAMLRMSLERGALQRQDLLRQKMEQSAARQRNREAYKGIVGDYRQGRNRLRQVAFTPLALPKLTKRVRQKKRSVPGIVGSGRGGVGHYVPTGKGGFERQKRSGPGREVRTGIIRKAQAGVQEINPAALWSTSGNIEAARRPDIASSLSVERFGKPQRKKSIKSLFRGRRLVSPGYRGFGK